MKDDQCARGEDDHPKQLVAEPRTEDRVGRDPGRIVIGEAREQSRP